MDDRSLYASILGLQAPWEVERVELKAVEEAANVFVHKAAGTPFARPECATAAPIYDHVDRTWLHLDTCQFQTLLHAAVPRVSCPTHGVRTIQVPWEKANGTVERAVHRGLARRPSMAGRRLASTSMPISSTSSS